MRQRDVPLQSPKPREGPELTSGDPGTDIAQGSVRKIAITA